MARSKSLFFLPLLYSLLLLPGCWMGDKYYEDVKCPLQGDEYVVRFAADVAAPALTIPRDFRPTCSTRARGHDAGIIEASLFIKYPDFAPAAISRFEDMTDRDIYLRISRNYTGALDAEARSVSIGDYVQANEMYKDGNGQNHFAPVETIDQGMAVQRGLTEGSGNVYFDRDPETGLSSSLTLCGASGRCEANGVTRDGAYHFSYVWMGGITAQEYPALNAGIQRFVESLALKN